MFGALAAMMETGAGERAPKMPLWVKIFIGVGMLIVVGLVVVLAVGGSEHGPGRHLGDHESPSGSATHGPGHTTSSTHHGTDNHGLLHITKTPSSGGQ